MARPRYLCPKCFHSTTKKAIDDHGMCPGCFRLYTRPSLDEVRDATPRWVKERVWERFREGRPAVVIAAELNRDPKVPKPEGWVKWDTVLVVHLDAERLDWPWLEETA